MFLKPTLGLLFIFTVSSFHTCNGQAKLEAVLLTRFTEGGTFAASAMYDGADSIYVFGGNRGGSPSNLISRLNISAPNPTMEWIGTMPGTGEYGLIQTDSEGNILYFNPGGGYPTPLFKFNPRNNSMTQVATIPLQMRHSSAVKYNESSNKVFIFGGENGGSRIVFSFDLDTYANQTVGNLPCQWNFMASKNVGRHAFIIGQHFNCASKQESDLTQSVLKMNMDTMTMEMGPQTFPKISGRPRSIYDGQYLYVIGGHTKNGSGWETNGIVQFNPATYEPIFIPVDNFPVGNNSHFEASPGVVYIAKQKRIYLFGGYSVNPTKVHDEIWYIDLNPLYATPNKGSQGKVTNVIFATAIAALVFLQYFLSF